MTIAIIGAQWGDEGKGKVVDYLCKEVDIIARCSGGPNAGHTIVIRNRKFILHHVPSGILHKNKLNVIGNGLVIDLLTLKQELANLRASGYDCKNLVISESAHLIFPFHRILDAMKYKGKIGTTGRGIGPSYADKINRTGIRVGDLLDKDVFKKKLEQSFHEKMKEIKTLTIEEIKHILEVTLRNERDGTHLGQFFDPHEGLSFNAIYTTWCSLAEEMRPMIKNTVYLINDALDKGKRLLIEGAQATLLDVDFGTYPYVTSSNSSVGSACTGLGIGPTRIKKIIGVAKAYATRVGSGPFPTELINKQGELLRERGGEYGSTTRRPRRCGWFDAVAVRYAAMINHLNALTITKLDVFDSFETIKVCVAYHIDGKRIEEFPMRLDQLEKSQPVYEELPGWKSATTKCRTFKDLPKNAQAYIKRLQELTKTKISIIGVGPRREQIIVVKGI